jgi:hypothetical protein
MSDQFRKDRLNALLVPVFFAGKALEAVHTLPFRIAMEIVGQPTRQEEVTEKTSMVGIFTPRSISANFDAGLIEMASILGISELRDVDDLLRDVAGHLGVVDEEFDEAKLLLKIAGKTGVTTANGSPFLVLESIGRSLGIPSENIFDKNAYYGRAEKYWVAHIAQRLKVRTVKDNEELLADVAQRLGVSLEKEDDNQKKLEKIAKHLGLDGHSGVNCDKTVLVSMIDAKLRSLHLSKLNWQTKQEINNNKNNLF